MAHLLPAAGVQDLGSDQFRFYLAVEGPDKGAHSGRLPPNIHDHRLPVYSSCIQHGNKLAYLPHHVSQGTANYACPGVTGYESFSGAGGSGYRYGGHETGPGCTATRPTNEGWGFCPPINVDPRSLIRPLNPSLDSSTRPTGAPYFAQETEKSCPPHRAPKARKGGFNYLDWLRTYKDRIPPEDLQGRCISSLCTLCQPVYVDCCPDYRNPWSYTISKKVAPYYF